MLSKKYQPLVATETTNPRRERAKALLNEVGAIKRVGENNYLVRSQSGFGGAYQVRGGRGKWTCNCPDAVMNELDCKHILAAQMYVLRPAQREPMTPTGSRGMRYTRAQQQEHELFSSLTADLLDTLDEPIQTLGRPRLSDHDLFWCGLQKVYARRSSRRSEALFKQGLVEGYVNRAPTYNSVNKFIARQDITDSLQELIRLSAAPLAAIEKTFAVDSSGFTTRNYSRWQHTKERSFPKNKKEHEWLKCHIIVGTVSNIVTDVVISDARRNDAPFLEPLVNNTGDRFQIEEVSADKAYSSRKNHDLIAELGAQPLIPFRDNFSPHSGGSKAWRKAALYFALKQESFYEQYHKRSNVESAFGAMKRKFGESLLSRTPTSQKNELLLKVLCYNITMLIRSMFMHGIDPDFVLEERRMRGCEDVYEVGYW